MDSRIDSSCCSLISVIVPIYNVERYLRKCINSIINQTHGNMEIILVDDGSPDRCGEICDEYAAKDKRIIVIHKENGGLSDARNAGLDIARGDYIQFVDSDDWLEKNTCEIALKTAIMQKADLVYFGYNVIKPNQTIQKVLPDTSVKQDKKNIMKELMWQRGSFSNASWNKLFARSLFDNVRFPKGMVYEDMGVIYKLLHRAENVCPINEALYNYALRSESITSNEYKYNAFKNRFFFFEERLQFLEQHYPEIVDVLLSMMLRDMLIGKEKMKGDPNYGEFLKGVDAFIEKYKSRIKYFAKYTRVTWVYYYLRPLLPLFIKIRG